MVAQLPHQVILPTFVLSCRTPGRASISTSSQRKQPSHPRPHHNILRLSITSHLTTLHKANPTLVPQCVTKILDNLRKSTWVFYPSNQANRNRRILSKANPLHRTWRICHSKKKTGSPRFIHIHIFKNNSKFNRQSSRRPWCQMSLRA